MSYMSTYEDPNDFFVITRRRFYLARTPWTHMNHVFRAVYLPSFDAQYAMIYCMLGIVTFFNYKDQQFSNCKYLKVIIHMCDQNLQHDKLKLTFRQYPAMHTNRMLYHCTTLQYNHNNILFDTVVSQKRRFTQDKWRIHQHTSMVGHVKIARSERS